jgi:hypothetical protein
MRTATVGERGLLERCVAFVLSARGVWLVVGLALVLALPSLSIGLNTDDRVFAYNAEHGTGALDLFSVTRAEVARARSRGSLAWWSTPTLELSFFRPLSSLLHTLEFRHHVAPWAMHALNVLLYMWLVAVVWHLYRTLLPRAERSAAVAALLFAIDDGHAPTVGWISGRNTLLASVLGLTALLLHIRARLPLMAATRRGLAHRFASAGLFALALMSAEAGVGVLGYMFAYAAIFEAGSWGRRLRSLWLQLLVVVAWLCVYRAGAYGVHGSSLYRDLNAPWLALREGLLDVPAWLTSLLGPSLMGSGMLFHPQPLRVVTLLLCVPLVLAVYAALPRTRETLFFASGALLSIVPLFTTLPQDRLLIVGSFGGFGVIASFFAATQADPRRGVRVARRILIGIHVCLSPLLFVVSLNQASPIDNGSRDLVAALPARVPAEVIVVNVPIELVTLYGWTLLREDSAHTPPRVLQSLYAGASELVVERTASDTLEVRAARGWGSQPIERVFGSEAALPRVGTTLQVGALSIQPLESDAAGRPTRVQFRFASALEAPERLWLAWNGRKPQPWRPPALGERVTLPGLGMFTSLRP